MILKSHTELHISEYSRNKSNCFVYLNTFIGCIFRNTPDPKFTSGIMDLFQNAETFLPYISEVLVPEAEGEGRHYSPSTSFLCRSSSLSLPAADTEIPRDF